ncbi:MAG: class IV adenylate cyclase [Solirubrobacteraceae bacterium]
MAASARRNIELKAVDREPDRSLEICRRLGAEDHGVLWQRDTYFCAVVGRIKLREQHPGDAHLIGYRRADEPQPRDSRYRIAPVTDPDRMLSLLAACLGVRVTVCKHRRLLLWHSVRIHLDEVDQLGCFIELEAVAAPDSDLEREHQLVAQLREALAITDERLIASGYADQLEHHATPGRSSGDAHRATSMSVTVARELAVGAHGDQRDRDGSLHIDHVARVADSVPSDDAHQRVAWLHDVIEDSDLGAEDLGPVLTAAELDAVRLLTHDPTAESYDDYIARIIDATGTPGALARTIKQADMLDNLNRCARDRDPAIAQYGRALARLWRRREA